MEEAAGAEAEWGVVGRTGWAMTEARGEGGGGSGGRCASERCVEAQSAVRG